MSAEYRENSEMKSEALSNTVEMLQLVHLLKTVMTAVLREQSTKDMSPQSRDSANASVERSSHSSAPEQVKS
jgi:hypothetical protein